jgi:hypothetical protein
LEPERSLASTDGRRRGEGKRNRASITSHPPPDERDWIDDPLLHTKHMSASASVRPSVPSTVSVPQARKQARKPSQQQPATPRTDKRMPHAPRTDRSPDRQKRSNTASPRGPAGAATAPAPDAAKRAPSRGRDDERSFGRPPPCLCMHLSPPRPGRKAAGRTTRILLDRALDVRRGCARANGEIDRRGERRLLTALRWVVASTRAWVAVLQLRMMATDVTPVRSGARKERYITTYVRSGEFTKQIYGGLHVYETVMS